LAREFPDEYVRGDENKNDELVYHSESSPDQADFSEHFFGDLVWICFFCHTNLSYAETRDLLIERRDYDNFSPPQCLSCSNRDNRPCGGCGYNVCSCEEIQQNLSN